MIHLIICWTLALFWGSEIVKACVRVWFVDTGKQKCFKVAGATTTATALLLSSPSPLVVSTIFLVIKQVRGVQRMMGTHGLMVTVVPISLHPALNFLPWRLIVWNCNMSTTVLRRFCHCNTVKLTIRLHLNYFTFSEIIICITRLQTRDWANKPIRKMLKAYYVTFRADFLTKRIAVSTCNRKVVGSIPSSCSHMSVFPWARH